MASRRRASRRNLTNSIGDMGRRLRYLEARPSYSSLANHVVQRQNIQPRSVATDQIALASITNDLIEAETIRAAELAANSVGNAELQVASVDTENFVVGSINNAAMGNDSVSTDNVQNDSITEPKIADGAASQDKIANGAVTEEKIASGAVTEGKIGSSAVTESKINNGAVTESKIALNAVTAGKIASNAVTNGKIQNGAVTTVKILDDAVTSAKISLGAVGFNEVQSGSLNQTIFRQGAEVATDVNGGTGISSSRSSGLYGSTWTVSANFGTASNQVARGNHTHGLSGSTFNTGGPSAGTSHTHTYFRPTSATASSSRVKKDISDADLGDLTRLLSLRPRRYKYRNSQRGLQEKMNREWMYGYIAEEVQEAGVSEILGYDENGEPDSVDYGLLSVLLLELVREQQTQINSLKDSVSRLQETE